METKIRNSAWENQFYPGRVEALDALLERFFSSVEKITIDGEIIGLVVPHAGYEYSGQTAAAAYSLLKGRPFNSIIILAPSHTDLFSGVSLYYGDYYETPFGPIPVSHSLGEKLVKASKVVRYSDEGHRTDGRRAEHSLEVQLPFLQKVLSENFEILPLVFHDYSWDNCSSLGNGLADIFIPGETLIVASSDLYHGESYEQCVFSDDETIKGIIEFDAEKFNRQANSGMYMACGAGPITALMIAAQKLGAKDIQLIHRTNSADVTGRKGGWTVGYASLLFAKNVKE